MRISVAFCLLLFVAVAPANAVPSKEVSVSTEDTGDPATTQVKDCMRFTLDVLKGGKHRTSASDIELIELTCVNEAVRRGDAQKETQE